MISYLLKIAGNGNEQRIDVMPKMNLTICASMIKHVELLWRTATFSLR